jgi:hypothetical protein
MNADVALRRGQSALEHACFLEDLSLTLEGCMEERIIVSGFVDGRFL